jgi:hypothetical protein
MFSQAWTKKSASGGRPDAEQDTGGTPAAR